jgi:hypothetical protein
LTAKEKEMIKRPISFDQRDSKSELGKFKAKDPEIGFNITKIDANNMDDSADSIDPLLSPKAEK